MADNRNLYGIRYNKFQEFDTAEIDITQNCYIDITEFDIRILACDITEFDINQDWEWI